jgi:hypothetical protein
VVDSIKTDLRERVFGGRNWIDLDKDRDKRGLL